MQDVDSPQVHSNWYSTSQLHLYQGSKVIVISDSVPFPPHGNQVSTLPTLHMLVKVISQVKTQASTLAIVPTIFNNTPKPNCYYSFTEMFYKPQQNLFVVPVLNIFGETLP